MNNIMQKCRKVEYVEIFISKFQNTWVYKQGYPALSPDVQQGSRQNMDQGRTVLNLSRSPKKVKKIKKGQEVQGRSSSMCKLEKSRLSLEVPARPKSASNQYFLYCPFPGCEGGQCKMKPSKMHLSAANYCPNWPDLVRIEDFYGKSGPKKVWIGDKKSDF